MLCPSLNVQIKQQKTMEKNILCLFKGFFVVCVLFCMHPMSVLATSSSLKNPSYANSKTDENITFDDVYAILLEVENKPENKGLKMPGESVNITVKSFLTDAIKECLAVLDHYRKSKDEQLAQHYRQGFFFETKFKARISIEKFYQNVLKIKKIQTF